MEYSNTGDLLNKVLEMVQKRLSKTGSGVSTGYTNLDKALGGFGFEAGCIYTFASRPSMGKTAFFLNLLANQLKYVKKEELLIYVSTQDTPHVLMQKLLAILSGVELIKIQLGSIGKEEFNAIEKAGTILKSAADQLIIVEKPTPYIEDLKGLFQKQYSAGKKVKMLFIDRIQDVEVGLQFNKEEVLKGVMSQLKTISAENSIPIILSSSVSRKVEYRREHKVPKLEDLLHSRHIGHLSDFVIMLLRPEYYEIPGEYDKSSISEAHLVIKKNQNGPLDTLLFETDISKQQFFHRKLTEQGAEII